MVLIARSPEGHFHPICRKQKTLAAALSLLLVAALSGLAQTVAKQPVKTATKKEPEIKEELTLTNGDRLTGQLQDSTGTEIKFKSDLAGEVTVALANIKELKSSREFAIVPKDLKDARDSALVPQGEIKISDKGIVITPPSSTKAGISAVPPGPVVEPGVPKVLEGKQVPSAKIEAIVEDITYQREIHRRIAGTSGWDGHITTGTTMIYSTQNSYLFQVNTALKRTVPTVDWLDPKLRSSFNCTLSAGKTTQPGTPETVTNIYHVDGERDLYFNRQGYYLGALSFDHNFAQGLILQQIYGAGVGATLFKRKNSEFDVTTDLHYESQQFNATANVSQLILHLVGSVLTEAYTQKWRNVHFDEKLLADVAYNNASAFSATATGSVRTPVYKNLGYSVSIIDNFLNNPQIGYKKNSFQLSTGLVLSLH